MGTQILVVRQNILNHKPSTKIQTNIILILRMQQNFPIPVIHVLKVLKLWELGFMYCVVSLSLYVSTRLDCEIRRVVYVPAMRLLEDWKLCLFLLIFTELIAHSICFICVYLFRFRNVKSMEKLLTLRHLFISIGNAFG